MEHGLDKLIKLLSHRVFKAPVRLAIMIYLLPRGEAYFSDMVEVLDVTPGNLWSHVEKLELEGYVKLRRVISGRPRVKIVLTDKGFREIIGYVKKIHDVINDLMSDSHVANGRCKK